MQQTQQPRPRGFRFADTPDYIGRYTAELLKMKAQSKSNGEMLAWLHTKGVDANMGEIAAFWQDLELQKQKQQQQQQKQQSGQQRQEQQQSQHRQSEPASSKGENGPPVRHSPTGGDGSGGTTNANAIFRHCPDLFRMRAEGKKTEDLLSYLQSIGVHTTFYELLRTMNMYREWFAEKEKEKERAQQNANMQRDGVGIAPELSENQGEAAPEQEEAEKQGQETEGEDRSTMAGKTEDGLVAPKRSEGGAARLMARFERILDQKFDDYDFGTDRSSADLKDINMMIRTVVSYEKDQARQEYRKELLRIKKADLELRAQKAKQAEARQKAADNNGSAEDFDNTEDIARMRKESFRDVDEYLASGEADDKIVEARRKGKAAGANVEEYVPPPRGTGLWTKPPPAESSGSPPAQTNPAGAAASSGIPSGKTQRATTEAPAAAGTTAPTAGPPG